jgi:hypothetical protein
MSRWPTFEERHVKQLLAAGRKGTNGRGVVQMYLPHACSHYEEIRLVDASEEIRLIMTVATRHAGDAAPEIPDTPAMREAIRTFVGYGVDDDGLPWVAVCHDSCCYPRSWSDQQIADCEVFVHGVVTASGPITAVTVPGPRAYCSKGCYRQTPHFFDVEVWPGAKGKVYQVVLRCEQCQYGRDLVTKDSPSRWRRLMQDETARRLLAGAKPDR